MIRAEETVIPEHIEEVLLNFEDGGSLSVSGARLELLERMDYCAARLSGRWSVPASDYRVQDKNLTLRIPCEKLVLEELFSLMETGNLSQDHEPTSILFAKIEAAADWLGVPRGENPLLERRTYAADLFATNPVLWRHATNEQTAISADDPNAYLVSINHDLVQDVRYDRPNKTSSQFWLFQELEVISDQNDKVMQDRPADVLLSQMPPVVIDILRRFPNCVAVAGGAVLGGVSRFADHGTDVDLFLYGLDEIAAAEVGVSGLEGA